MLRSVCEDHALGKVSLISRTSVKIQDRSNDFFDLCQVLGRVVSVIQEGSKLDGRKLVPKTYEEGGNIEISRDDTQ